MNVLEEAVLLIFPRDMVFTNTERSALAVGLVIMSMHEVFQINSLFPSIGKEMILTRPNLISGVPLRIP